MHFFLLIITVIYFSSSSIGFAAEENNIDVFVNQSVPDRQYTLSDIRSIFAMRKTNWDDGTKINVYVLADSAKEHRQFTKYKLNMFPHQFRRIWDRYIFSGTGHAPQQVTDLTEMLQRIADTPGAIGYLYSNTHDKKIRKLIYE